MLTLALQLKARARITLKPLVETIPCLGAVTVSLLEVPTVDLGLMLLNHLDIMALPGLNFAANLGLKLVQLHAQLAQLSMSCWLVKCTLHGCCARHGSDFFFCVMALCSACPTKYALGHKLQRRSGIAVQKLFTRLSNASLCWATSWC